MRIASHNPRASGRDSASRIWPGTSCARSFHTDPSHINKFELLSHCDSDRLGETLHKIWQTGGKMQFSSMKALGRKNPNLYKSSLPENRDLREVRYIDQIFEGRLWRELKDAGNI